jgi:hypothetical protein
MSTDPRSAFLENVLLQEYLRVCSDVRSLEANGDKLISIAMAAFALATTVGVEKNVSLVFIGLPVALVGLLVYAIMIYVWIFSLCGYKEHLEKVINSRCNSNILLWEVLVSKRESANIARQILIAVYLVASGGMIYFSVVKVFEAYGAWFGFSLAVFCAVSGVLLMLSWRQRSRVAKRIYLTATSLYWGDLPSRCTNGD